MRESASGWGWSQNASGNFLSLLLCLQVEVNGRKKLVHRNYKELLWLHRNLTRIVELGGHIVRYWSSSRVEDIF